jgi:ElaB/YqjD/DUF883 family membrane-anchored ribosome-binding protein
MRAYLTPLGQVDDQSRQIDMEEGAQVGIYRDGQQVLVETPRGTKDLGVRDVTVSRKKSGEPSVSFRAVTGEVEIMNHPGSKNSLTLRQQIRDERSIAPGETEQVTESCVVEVGFNTEVRLTIKEQTGRKTLRADEAEELLNEAAARSSSGGPTLTSHARVLAENLRAKRHHSPNDCLQVANEVRDFVEENPVETSIYEDVRKSVERVVEKLEAKLSSRAALGGDELAEEDRERIERVASRVEGLYSRAG